MSDNPKTPNAGQRGGFLGSLKDALAAASRDETGAAQPPAPPAPQRLIEAKPPALPADSASDAAHPAAPAEPPKPAAAKPEAVPSAEQAARGVRATVALRDRHVETEAPPTTRVFRAAKPAASGGDEAPRTQLVRGKQKLSRGEFQQDPVVGWLVIVGGPGLGAFRPIFEGNNTVGRAKTQRIALDFGDDAISSEEQAYIRYDSAERSYLFVPNLAKTNVVSVNEKRPTGAVELSHMDVITMGRTQLVFVPFCGADFDWSELQDVKD
mgnify:CR=1 FL=1